MRVSSKIARFVLCLAALGFGACRASNDGKDDGGQITSTVQDLNGGLALPGVPVAISPNNPVATSVKVLVRSETVPGGPPNCLYGFYASDPGHLPGSDAGYLLNNGLLISALGDNNILDNDPSLGGQGRTDCPTR